MNIYIKYVYLLFVILGVGWVCWLGWAVKFAVTVALGSSLKRTTRSKDMIIYNLRTRLRTTLRIPFRIPCRAVTAAAPTVAGMQRERRRWRRAFLRDGYTR